MASRDRDDLALVPALAAWTFVDGNITRYPGSHYLDFVINGQSVSSMAADAGLGERSASTRFGVRWQMTTECGRKMSDGVTAANSDAPKRQRGPNDPDRRDRVGRAAITVIAEQGIGALTHRRVAATAGVLLGSMTYHFATLDDLVEAALAQAAEWSVAALRAWVGALEPDANLAQALAGFVVEPVVEKREDTMAEYNLYALALHRPHLREATVDWDHALAAVLAARTDPLTGRMLAVLLCGLMMQTVLSDEPSTRSDVERLIARALGS